MLSTPRLVVAGSASGVGKTTVMVALARALRRRGLRVAVFKCGPDYLDPTYHARAAGVACHNLDGWMMGREAVVATFARAAADADVALVEGVMGLYDGVSPRSNEGSAAEVARWLEAPVLAVIDAAGMARTVAAIGLGLGALDRELKWAGLFANRVGSRGHLELLQAACRQEGAPPVIGGLPSQTALSFPERHLGLQTASQEAIPEALLDEWATLLEQWCDLPALLAGLRAAPPLPLPAPAPPPQRQPCRLGLAQDAAFHFYYEDNLRRLEALGATLVPFSPLRDAHLPTVDGVLIGGGYPELHARALAANLSMRDDLRAFAAAGRPVYAECGGLMYLADALRTVDGECFPMLGLVSGTAVMHDRLQALGYVEIETQRSTILGGAGLRVRGHQFRYSTLEGARGAAYRMRRRRDDATSLEGYGVGNVLGSYVHLHWASNPLAAVGLVAACARG